MPIYEYTCKTCGHRFKDVENANGKETVCPECANEDLEKADLNTYAPDKDGCSASKKSPFR